ncbi:MAG: 30S ribosomal protein S13 [Chloroflexi bacterium]|nr:30S ribosomal protein S13 [Chloroflexota bacterium]
MALVAGVNIPDNKRVEIALRSVYGVGPAVARRVIEESALPGNPRVRELSEEELNRLRGALDRSGALIEGDLRREVQGNVRRLIDIGSYRGLRHRRGLPVRGQRTKTNARTKRGRRRAIANKKKVGH